MDTSYNETSYYTVIFAAHIEPDTSKRRPVHARAALSSPSPNVTVHRAKLLTRESISMSPRSCKFRMYSQVSHHRHMRSDSGCARLEASALLARDGRQRRVERARRLHSASNTSKVRCAEKQAVISRRSLDPDLTSHPLYNPVVTQVSALQKRPPRLQQRQLPWPVLAFLPSFAASVSGGDV